MHRFWNIKSRSCSSSHRSGLGIFHEVSIFSF